MPPDTPDPASPAATERALLPCPFCGGEPEYDNSDTSPSWWYVCRDCGAKTASARDDKAAMAAWNRRATPDLAALRAERDRLRGLVERLSDAAGGLSQGIRMINQDGPVMEVCVMVEALRDEARAALAEGRADG